MRLEAASGLDHLAVSVNSLAKGRGAIQTLASKGQELYSATVLDLVLALDAIPERSADLPQGSRGVAGGSTQGSTGFFLTFQWFDQLNPCYLSPP